MSCGPRRGVSNSHKGAIQASSRPTQDPARPLGILTAPTVSLAPGPLNHRLTYIVTQLVPMTKPASPLCHPAFAASRLLIPWCFWPEMPFSFQPPLHFHVIETYFSLKTPADARPFLQNPFTTHLDPSLPLLAHCLYGSER